MAVWVLSMSELRSTAKVVSFNKALSPGAGHSVQVDRADLPKGKISLLLDNWKGNIHHFLLEVLCLCINFCLFN